MQSKKPSASRIVHYAFTVPGDEADFLNCEVVLAKAKRDGIITNYDDGRDRDPWFEAPPGEAARKLRDRFLAAGYITLRWPRSAEGGK